MIIYQYKITKKMLAGIIIHMSIMVMRSFVAEPIKPPQVFHMIRFATVFAFYGMLHTLYIFHMVSLLITDYCSLSFLCKLVFLFFFLSVF